MSQETLKYARFLIPGILLTVVFEPLLSLSTLIADAGLPDLASYIGWPIQVFLFGLAYEVLNLRSLTFSQPVKEVTDNIKTSLLSYCRSNPDIVAASSDLRAGRKMMHIFYRFVDSDPTLSQKAKNVRFNGLIWSSLADIQVVGAMGTLAYLAASAGGSASLLLISIAMASLVAVIRWWMMPRTTAKHVDLSNQQLEIIGQDHRAELCERLAALIPSVE